MTQMFAIYMAKSASWMTSTSKKAPNVMPDVESLFLTGGPPALVEKGGVVLNDQQASPDELTQADLAPLRFP